MDLGEVGMDGLVGPKSNGSGFVEKGRCGSGEEDWRGSKVAKTNDFVSQNTMLYQKGTNQFLRSNSLLSGDYGGQHQNLLSFSSPRPEATFLSKDGVEAERSTQNPAFPYSQQTSHAYSRKTGMHGPLGLGARVPFTPSQWVELEHQALIYKYIVANVPVPANLLIALKKSLNPYGLYGWPSRSYAPDSLGAGSFHLGFSGNTDPELGRCRRTDGKKWRCSRDAVGDQKYCEKHINRGRHRSRKPVECRSTTNVAPIACSALSTSVVSSNGADNCSAGVLVNRMQNPPGHTVVSPATNLKAKHSPFSISKHSSIDESSPSQFCPFTDDGTKDQSCGATIAWPEELKSDWTQLSMSIPLAVSDFSSTSSLQEKITFSPFRLSQELDPIQKQTNWIPISWGSSMGGGPLGEVMNTSKAVGVYGSPQLGSSPTGVLQKTTYVSLSNSSSCGSPRADNKKTANGSGSLVDDVGSTLASSFSVPSL